MSLLGPRVGPCSLLFGCSLTIPFQPKRVPFSSYITPGQPSKAHPKPPKLDLCRPGTFAPCFGACCTHRLPAFYAFGADLGFRGSGFRGSASFWEGSGLKQSTSLGFSGLRGEGLPGSHRRLLVVCVALGLGSSGRVILGCRV